MARFGSARRTPSVPLPTVHLLRQGPVARLFVGTALNALGTWVTLIALWGYASVHFHQGARGLALIGLAWGLPAALVSPVAGVPIDRLGPKRVLLAANLLGAVASTGLALSNTFDVLVVVSAFAGVVEAFGRPAAMALPARLVDPGDLRGVNALINAAEQSSIVFGPVVGAAAITAAGYSDATAATCRGGPSSYSSPSTCARCCTDPQPSSGCCRPRSAWGSSA
jgi:MFS family permease